MLLGSVGATGVSAASNHCDITVDASGEGDYNSIEDGIENANDGDTICVKPTGPYSEPVIVDTSVTLVGDPGDDSPGAGPNAPVLDGGGRFGFSLGVPEVTIEGFVIQNYPADNLEEDDGGKGIEANSPTEDIVIQNNTFSNFEIDGVGIAFFGDGKLKNTVIQRNVIERAANIGIRIDSEDPENVAITENRFHRNDTGVKVHSGVKVHRNDFEGNEVAVKNRDPHGEPVVAECNWWDHPTGPTDSDNRRGQGDEVGDGVEYDPWLRQTFERVPGQSCGSRKGNSS